MNYYNRKGEPITFDEWVALYANDFDLADARRVGNDTITDPQGREHQISTVHLGIDHNFFGDGPPLIFESMVFCHHNDDCPWSDWQDRYATEDLAVAGHVTLVTRVSEGLPPLEETHAA